MSETEFVHKRHAQYLGGLSHVSTTPVLCPERRKPSLLSALFSPESPNRWLLRHPALSSRFLYFPCSPAPLFRDYISQFIKSIFYLSIQQFSGCISNRIINTPEAQLQFHSSSLCICSQTFSKETIQFLTRPSASWPHTVSSGTSPSPGVGCLSFLSRLFLSFRWKFRQDIFDSQSTFLRSTFPVLSVGNECRFSSHERKDLPPEGGEEEWMQLWGLHGV